MIFYRRGSARSIVQRRGAPFQSRPDNNRGRELNEFHQGWSQNPRLFELVPRMQSNHEQSELDREVSQRTL
jgi:hypothetical protein